MRLHNSGCHGLVAWGSHRDRTACYFNYRVPSSMYGPPTVLLYSCSSTAVAQAFFLHLSFYHGSGLRLRAGACGIVACGPPAVQRVPCGAHTTLLLPLEVSIQSQNNCAHQSPLWFNHHGMLMCTVADALARIRSPLNCA